MVGKGSASLALASAAIIVLGLLTIGSSSARDDDGLPAWQTVGPPPQGRLSKKAEDNLKGSEQVNSHGNEAAKNADGPPAASHATEGVDKQNESDCYEGESKADCDIRGIQHGVKTYTGWLVVIAFLQFLTAAATTAVLLYQITMMWQANQLSAAALKRPYIFFEYTPP